MINVVSGNLLKDPAEALVNPVNCVGVMGRGLALQFKTEWPSNYSSYVAACRDGRIQPGRVFAFLLDERRWIVNFPTKRHWRDQSRLRDIEEGLRSLRSWITTNNVSSVAIPALGCGLGQLRWPTVRSTIEGALEGLDCTVRLYPPGP